MATGLEPGMPLKHLRTNQALVLKGLLNHYEILRSTFPKTGTKFDAHSLFLWSIVKIATGHVHAPNKRVWKLPTSTQLCATWHTDSLDMVVLTSTGASCYHNCCIDGGTSLENFGYHLVCDNGWLLHYLLPEHCQMSQVCPLHTMLQGKISVTVFLHIFQQTKCRPIVSGAWLVTMK